MRTVTGWTFAPATRNGTPVKAKIRVVARFVAQPPASPPLPTPPKAPQSPRDPAPPPPPPPATPISVTIAGETPPRNASSVVKKRDVLGAAPHRTASDLLKVLPGVFITQHGGQGKAHQIFLRGFDAGHGQDIELRVAGAPVNEVSNVHGQGYADLHFIMPEVVRRVRATPGPFDPRQGDFAVAGTIEFDLGLAQAGFTTSFGLGTYGERRVFVAYRPRDASEETFAAVEAQSTDGFGPSRAARRASAVAQWVFPVGNNVSVRFMASAYAARFSSAGVLLRDDVENGGIDRFGTYDPRQGGDSTRAQVVVGLEHESDDGAARSALTPFFIGRSLRLRTNYTGFLVDSVNGDSQQQMNEAFTLGFSGYHRRKIRIFSPEDSLEVGTFARSDFIDQSQKRLSVVDDHVTGTLVDANIRAVDAAAWIDASLRPVRRVVVRGGVRVDGLYYGVTDLEREGSGAARAAMGTHVGGKATVDVALHERLHALASYGDGFRSPQARSLGDGERAPFTTVRSFEGGLRYAHGDRANASVAVFHTRLSDDLVFEETTARNERAPATMRTGFSLDFTMRPKPWIVESGSVTYTHATFSASDANHQEGALVPYTPLFVAHADVALTPKLARILGRDLVGHIGTGLSYLGRRPLPYGEFGRDIFLADVSVGLRLREVGIKVDMENLLDAQWYDGQFTYASSFVRGAAPSLVPRQVVTVGAPFTLMATLSLYLGS
ncbi:MAG: TonB-dependent receptor plug domain-containing protein [Polyangiaceae bacterium]|nr:TonB-dependent receptor plug domain-containing protein [Polyangiaceae bacterium]